MNKYKQFLLGMGGKLSLALYFIGILIPISSFCQQDAPVFKDLKDPQILKLLFDTKKIDPNGVALWKPNFAESGEFNVSSDGLCHTNIDTVMECPGYNTRKAIIFFSTYGIDGDGKREDCHACGPDVGIAVLSRQKNNSWKLGRFKKHLIRWGQWGLFDGESLQKIGDKTYGLKFEGGGMNQGISVSIMRLYDLESLDEIFSSFTHEDNSGASESDSAQYGWDKKIEFIKAKNSSGYYDILVTLSGKGYKTEYEYDSPIVNLSGKERYRFHDGLDKYVIVK